MTATDSTFTDNTAAGSGRGGAVYTDGSVTVTDSTFTGNTANSDGGAIYKFGVGSVTVTGSTFTNNTASRNNGGAIRASQSVTVTDSTLHRQHRQQTRGGHLRPLGDGDRQHSHRQHRQRQRRGHRRRDRDGDRQHLHRQHRQHGGAIDAGGLVEVTGSTFTGNIATSGGGAIFNLGPVRVTVTATDSTFTGNTATLGGGAILSDNVRLLYATVVENTALNGANLYGSSLVSFGSVVAGHPVNSTNCYSFLSFASSGYNYSDDSSCGFSDGTDVQRRQ